MNQPSVYVLILNWNRKEETIRCLESLKRLEYTNYRVVVVDNGSQDSSVEAIRQRFPSVTLTENRQNLGFAQGNNVGIEYVLKKGADYIFLLNNDVVLNGNLLDILVKVAESHPLIGIVAPVNFYVDKVNKVCSAGRVVKWWLGAIPTMHVRNIEEESICRRIIDVDCVSGSALLIKKELVKKIGLFSGDYFAYLEDDDWCIRAKRAGYRVVFSTEAKVRHYLSKSTPLPLRTYLITRNRPLFMVRNATKVHLVTFFPIYIIHTLARICLFLVKGNSYEAIAMAKGFTDFWLGRFGKGRVDEFL